MVEISGKARGMLARLPHFYAPTEAGDVLLQLADIFARRLDRAEADVYRVLRAHHVETADNEGSQGYTAPVDQRGDLDKIFALYLEVLGGTSLLVRMNPHFTSDELKSRRLVDRLRSGEKDTNPLLQAVWDQLSPAGQQQISADEFSDSDLQKMGTALAAAFNRLLAMPALFAKAAFPFPDELDEEEYDALEKRYGPRSVWLHRLLLDAAFPNEIASVYGPYRERLRGLIRVLREGASTRQGIVEIVAVNLGIVGDTEAATQAKALIDIEEYLPRQTHFGGERGVLLGFGDTFDITNPGPSDQTPQVWVKMLNADPGVEALANIQLVDKDSRQTLRFPGRMRVNDQLVFRDAGVWLNGIVPNEQVVGEVPTLAGNTTATWRFEADVVAPDQAILPVGRFDDPAGAYDQSVLMFDAPVVQVQVMSSVNTPGILTVVVPWHIPGYTDKFAEAGHPRHQILSLVNRVKAAGVRAMVAYRQVFAEVHEHAERLDFAIRALPFPAASLLGQKHELRDKFEIDSRQANREDQDMQDVLSFPGLFDYTAFDSHNTFD